MTNPKKIMPLIILIMLALLLILFTYLYFERRIRQLDEKMKTGSTAFRHTGIYYSNSHSKTQSS